MQVWLLRPFEHVILPQQRIGSLNQEVHAIIVRVRARVGDEQQVHDALPVVTCAFIIKSRTVASWVSHSVICCDNVTSDSPRANASHSMQPSTTSGPWLWSAISEELPHDGEPVGPRQHAPFVLPAWADHLLDAPAHAILILVHAPRLQVVVVQHDHPILPHVRSVAREILRRLWMMVLSVNPEQIKLPMTFRQFEKIRMRQL